MRSASDNGLDNTSFARSWATNSNTGRGSIKAAEAISIEHKIREIKCEKNYTTNHN